MTKADLIEAVAGKMDLPKATAERTVNLIFDDITSALKGARQGQYLGLRHVYGLGP